MNELAVCQDFDFYGDKIIATKHDDVWYFFPRHMCESLGVAWQVQQRKIAAEAEKFNCHHMVTVGKDNKKRKMLGIPATRINTWILGINASRVKEESRAALRKYQDQLSDWLYEAGFLGAVVNESVPANQMDNVIAAAKERALKKQLTIQDKLELVQSLPDTPQYADYKCERIQLITDVQLGVKSPALLGEPLRINKQNFYRVYGIEGHCDDKIICSYPFDFSTPKDIRIYAKEANIKRADIPYPDISFAQGCEMTKAALKFKWNIADLVIKYNLPAELIQQKISLITFWLKGIFKENEIEVPLPPTRNQQTLGARLTTYRNTDEWWTKRNAYFTVFNCCVDCPPEIGWELASKNFNLHHLSYWTLGKEDPSDLVPLCKECHDKREAKL
jgi:hypothetical protein